METTNQTVSQRYSKEIEEIEQMIDSSQIGIAFKFQLLTAIKSLAIDAYYTGKCEGMQQMHEILKN